jgi:hypothetical protein
MLLRLLVPQEYPLAIACSYLGIRRFFSPDEIFANRIALGVCVTSLCSFPARAMQAKRCPLVTTSPLTNPSCHPIHPHPVLSRDLRRTERAAA